jgi:hypothetical protein
MPSEERQFWYALTLAASGLVMIGASSQTVWGIFLALGGGVWISYIERDRIRAGLRNFLNAGQQPDTISAKGTVSPVIAPDLTSPAAVTIDDPRSGQVPHRKSVKGTVRPAGGSVQVFVQAGLQTDPWWYRQGAVSVQGGVWTARCNFGNENAPTGSSYKMCAIVGAASVSDKRIKTLPSDGTKSGTISVTLNRSLQDDWTKQ